MLKHPMKKPGIAIDSARCMACYACFMACKDEHCGWDTDLTKSQPQMGQYLDEHQRVGARRQRASHQDRHRPHSLFPL